MAVNRQGGAGINLPLSNPIIGPVSAANPAGAVDLGAGSISLAAGQTMIIPAGQFFLSLGDYTFFQVYDPRMGIWRSASQAPQGGAKIINSDGANMRLANLTGCVLGALITNVGSAYTSAPTVTPSAGGSTWTAVVGGAINATVTVTTAGLGYTYPPTLVVSPPPVGGVQATAVAVVSASAISSVTVINQGAGYTVAPTITVIPDPRDTITTQAALTVNATLAGAGTITALLCTNPGTPLTAVPTLAFSGGGGSSAAATTVMCLVATGFTVGAGGAAYGNAQPFGIVTTGGIVPGTPGAVVNPQLDAKTFVPRQANISGTSTAGGAITATAAVINDAGLFQAVPSALVIAGGTGLATTVGQATITVGGITDSSLLYPV